jgi:hypothetical protein
MATVDMWDVGGGGYEYSAVLAAAGNTSDILVPAGVQQMTVTIEAAGGATGATTAIAANRPVYATCACDAAGPQALGLWIHYHTV